MLRDKFYRADLGISGANFAVAETGTIVLITNEGNGRLTTTWPRIHVAVMGIEKVLPRLQDLPVFLKLLARAATGQPLSVYTTLISGPRRPASATDRRSFTSSSWTTAVLASWRRRFARACSAFAVVPV